MPADRSLAVPRDAVAHPGRALLVLAAVLGATVLLLGLGMPAARAHDELVGTTPAADATVPVPPTTVTLEFSRAVQSFGAEVLVTGPDGAPMSQGDADVRDATVVQLLAAAPAGEYAVAWRVTAADGHPLSGEFTFTVAAGSQPVAPTASAPPPEPVREAAAQEPVESSSLAGPIAVGGALLAAAGGLAVLRRRWT